MKPIRNFVSILSIYSYAVHAGVPYQGTMIHENRALLPSYFKEVAYNNNATRMNLSGVHAKNENINTEAPYTIHEALFDSIRYLKSLQNNTFLAKGIKESYENKYQLVLHRFVYLLQNTYRALSQASMVLQKEDVSSAKKAQHSFLKPVVQSVKKLCDISAGLLGIESVVEDFDKAYAVFFDQYLNTAFESLEEIVYMADVLKEDDSYRTIKQQAEQSKNLMTHFFERYPLKKA